MKIKDIREKNTSDLEKMLSEKREAIRSSRFGASGSKSRNVKSINSDKKDIARILTVLKQKSVIAK